MLDVAHLTDSVKYQLEVPLQTTQLIFVHSNFIDISFRKEERRFDVEGAYNIRYQMMKKRIDKVRIRDTNERLTQPGTVSVIYLNEESHREYMTYLKRFEKERDRILSYQLVELEELQGVSGLKAIRIAMPALKLK